MTAGADCSARLAAALRAIDAANALDPEVLEWGGEPRPKELLHAELVSAWVRRLDPEAGEAQLLAARAHHFRRWTTPRSGYPEGRAGYLRWRAEAARRHAAEVSHVLRSSGYDDRLVDRVAAIIRKEGRAGDPDVQTHEDALCLMFLQTQLADVAARLGDDRARSVLSRTLGKMSPRAVSAAKELDLSPRAASLLRDALGSIERREQASGP